MNDSLVIIESLSNGVVLRAAVVFSGDSAKAIEQYYKILRVLEKAFPYSEAGYDSSHFFFIKQGGEAVLSLSLRR